MREVANKYLANPREEQKTAVAVLGEQKEWVEKDGWAILDVSFDENAFEIPEIPELAPKVEL